MSLTIFHTLNNKINVKLFNLKIYFRIISTLTYILCYNPETANIF